MKNNTYNILSLFICLLFFNKALAQEAPGLFGKRLFVNIGTSAVYAGLSTNYNELDRTYADDFFLFDYDFSYNYQLEVHYATSRVRTIGFNYTLSRTGTGTYERDDVDYNENVISNMLQFSRRRYLEQGGGFPLGGIAPLGWYYQLGVCVSINHSYSRESLVLNPNAEKINGEWTYLPGINFELGDQFIISDKLLISTAIQTGILAPVYGLNDLYYRLGGYYVVRFKVSVGLPFDVNK